MFIVTCQSQGRPVSPGAGPSAEPGPVRGADPPRPWRLEKGERHPALPAEGGPGDQAGDGQSQE